MVFSKKFIDKISRGEVLIRVDLITFHRNMMQRLTPITARPEGNRKLAHDLFDSDFNLNLPVNSQMRWARPIIFGLFGQVIGHTSQFKK